MEEVIKYLKSAHKSALAIHDKTKVGREVSNAELLLTVGLMAGAVEQALFLLGALTPEEAMKPVDVKIRPN